MRFEDYIEPPLDESQIAVRDLSGEILSLKPHPDDLTFWNILSRSNPVEIEKKLRDSEVAHLLMRPDENLGIEGDEHLPDIKMTIGSSALVAVSLRAWEWRAPKTRRDPDDTSTSGPMKLLRFKGQQDWTNQLDLILHYEFDGHEAAQEIGAYTGSRSSGEVPPMHRSIDMDEYFETGYEGHARIYDDTLSREAVLGFVAIARSAFDGR